MPKTAFVFGEPRTRYILKDFAPWFLNWITVKYLEEIPSADFPPVVLSFVEVPDSNMVAITYANRYEVK